MVDTPAAPDNVEHLLKHLKADSLAASLVIARRDCGTEGPAVAMRAVLKARLKQERDALNAKA